MGNTLTRKGVYAIQGDHPHLRGEYLIGKDLWIPDEGSPPLAWGILKMSSKTYGVDGITPTCVGNTPITIERPSLCKDHPHLRGEY